MSEEITPLTILESIDLVKGKRESIHCFVQAPFALIGADWSWESFETALSKATYRTMAGERARALGHPLALSVDGKWIFFSDGSIGS